MRKGDFDPVHARFLGEVTAAAMDATERGGIGARIGITHAEAYGELTQLVLATVGAWATSANKRHGWARSSAG